MISKGGGVDGARHDVATPTEQAARSGVVAVDGNVDRRRRMRRQPRVGGGIGTTAVFRGERGTAEVALGAARPEVVAAQHGGG